MTEAGLSRSATVENSSRVAGFDRWFVFWILAGCALRLTGLGVHSLWYDELCSIDVARSADPIAVLRRDHHPPLFFYLLRWWSGLGGEGDVWLRLLPALLSCVTLALFAQWTNSIARGSSRLAVALFAVAPFQIWHGQELRAYPLLEVGVLLALIGAEHVRSGRMSLAALLVVAGQAIAFGAHYMGAMLLPAIAAVALLLGITGAATWRRAVLLVVACGGGIAAWSPFLVANFGTQRGAPWGSAVHLGWRDLLELPVRHVLIENASVPQPWLAGLYFVALSLLALWCASIASVVRRREPSECRVAAIFFGPLIGVLAAVVFLHSGFQPKYVFAASPATVLMIALGATSIPWPSVRVVVTSLVVAGTLSLSLWHKTGNLREDYRSACAEIEAAWQPGDLIVSITGTVEPFSSASLRHYFRTKPELIASIASEADIAALLQRVNANKSRLHVVYREADYAAASMAQVPRSLTLVDRSPNRFRIIRTLWKVPDR